MYEKVNPKHPDKIAVFFRRGSSYSIEKLFYNKHKDYEPTFEDMLFNK